MKLLGLDPSLSNFGIVCAEFDPDSMEFEVTNMVLSTATTNKNKQIRRNSDDLERCRQHVDRLTPMMDWADIVMCEMPQGSQSARAMASYGACIGMLSWISKPLIQVTPTEVKLSALGVKTASKNDMIKWAFKKFPRANWMMRANKPIARNEHLADAIGVISASIETDDFKHLMAAYRMARSQGTPHETRSIAQG